MKKDEYIKELAAQLTMFGVSAFSNQDIERSMNNDGTAHISVFGSKGFVEGVHNVEELLKYIELPTTLSMVQVLMKKLKKKIYGQERFD